MYEFVQLLSPASACWGRQELTLSKSDLAHHQAY